jgi:hypothetical protein
MAQPQKPRVLFDLVNEPTIRCPLCVDITYYPLSIFAYVANEFITSSPARPSPTLLAVRVFQRPTPRQDPSPVAARTFAFSFPQRSSIDFPTHAISPQTSNSLPDDPLLDAKLHPAKLHPAK